MWPNLQETADLVTFTLEIFNRKLYFLCSAYQTSMMELCCENRSRLKAVKYFRKTSPSEISTRVINTSMRSTPCLSFWLSSSLLNCMHEIRHLNTLQTKELISSYCWTYYNYSIRSYLVNIVQQYTESATGAVL